MLAAWPEPDPAYDFPADAARMDGVLDAIRAVRNLRAEMKVPVGRRAQLMALPQPGWGHILADAAPLFQRLAWVSELTLLDAAPDAGRLVSAVCPIAELYIPLGDLVDFEKETARLAKECAALRKETARAEGLLNNPGFTGKAPAHLVEAERAKLEANRAMLATLEARAAALRGL